MDERDYQQRIAERAHRIWQDEGQPEGRADAHWDLARLAVSLEDAQDDMLKPTTLPGPESAEILSNLGEFPTLTDQGEQQVPGQIDDA